MLVGNVLSALVASRQGTGLLVSTTTFLRIATSALLTVSALLLTVSAFRPITLLLTVALVLLGIATSLIEATFLRISAPTLIWVS